MATARPSLDEFEPAMWPLKRGKEQWPRPEPDATILVVEDDDGFRGLIVRILRALGYTVLDARDGRDALARYQIAGSSIDLVLTDVAMPHVDGIELGRQLREQRQDLPLLYMSGYSAETLGGRLPTNSTGFIRKPFTMDRVAACVDELLSGSQAERVHAPSERGLSRREGVKGEQAGDVPVRAVGKCNQ